MSAPAGLANGDSLIGISNLIGSATGNNTLIGNSGANVLTGGAGNDVIDGAGGADTLIGAGGDDTIVYRGSEISIDGGTGTNTLALATAVVVNLANADQTSGDTVNVTNFQNVDASALSDRRFDHGLDRRSTSSPAGPATDTIDGGGGADIIHAGAGNDSVTYRGTEALIDGGGDTNTLVMLAQANVNLAAADQTSGDTTVVTSFQNVDASALTSTQPMSIIGSSSINVLTGGAGNDTIDGGGGADIISGGGGDDTIAYRGTENTIDGGSGNNTLLLQAAVTVNLRQCRPDDGRRPGRQQFHQCRCVGAERRRQHHRLDRRQHDQGRLGRRCHRWRRRRRYDHRRGGQRHRHLSRHRNRRSTAARASIRWCWRRRAASPRSTSAVAASADQTVGDTVNVTRFENLDASALSSNLTVIGIDAAPILS